MGINLSLVGRVFAATAVIASTVFLGLPSAVSADPMDEGSISGTVLDEMGNQLEGICVSVNGVTGTTTDQYGNYSFPVVPVGQHRVQFSDCRPNPTYLTRWYLGTRDEDAANWIDVYGQSDTALSVVYMVPGVSMTGTVIDMAGNPVQGIRVQLEPQGNLYNSISTVTDMYGQYRTEPVENGQYKVKFTDDQYPRRYATEYWNDQYIMDNAQNLDLQASNGTTVNGIDAQLGAPATITGHVQNKSAMGIEQVCVEAVTPGQNNQLGSTQTDSSGDYTLSGLPPTTVIVRFQDCGNPRQHLDQFYNGVSDSRDAQQLSLSPGNTTSGIDATLETGAIVSGTVTDSAGNPMASVNVSIVATDHSVSSWVGTNPAGKYSSSPLPPGDYRVRFEPNDDSYAIQYWNGQTTRDSATILKIQNTSPVSDINAQLALGARITGNVTLPNGAPAPNICVESTNGTGNNPESDAWAGTDTSGNYELKRLPAGPHRVRFQDCQGSGPYSEQWYDGSGSRGDAQFIDLTAGENRSGVNAQMQVAAQIKGTVTDTGSTPLPDICVQASTDDFLGGTAETDENGNYSIMLSKDGQYRVQFMDCGDSDNEPPIPGGTYLAQWWGGGLEPATAKEISVADGAAVNNIDAALALADGTGTVTGHIANVRGEPLNACVVLYLPKQSVRFAMTDTDGNYSFADVPTGTWTIAFLGCGNGDDDGPSPVIPDAGETGVFYNAVWFDGKPLEINDENPDPIAQGATLVTIGPDEAFTADMCFGCGALKVKPPVIGEDFILVDFDTTGLSTDDGTKAGAQATFTYQVECDSKTGTSTSASQDNYPVKVSGFTPGAPYVCSARILSNGVDVADSTTFAVTVGKATATAPGGEPSGGPSDNPATPTQPSNNSGTAAGPTAQPVSYNTSGAAPAKLAYTGGNIAAVAALAMFMILMGIGVIATSMRMDSHQGSARAGHANR